MRILVAICACVETGHKSPETSLVCPKRHRSGWRRNGMRFRRSWGRGPFQALRVEWHQREGHAAALCVLRVVRGVCGAVEVAALARPVAA